MQPDHTASEFGQTQPLLATSLDAVASAADVAPRQRMNALTRVTFCFAWLFGLEPFLSSSADDTPSTRLDRH